jgi:hypothetical protein
MQLGLFLACSCQRRGCSASDISRHDELASGRPRADRERSGTGQHPLFCNPTMPLLSLPQCTVFRVFVRVPLPGPVALVPVPRGPSAPRSSHGRPTRQQKRGDEPHRRGPHTTHTHTEEGVHRRYTILRRGAPRSVAHLGFHPPARAALSFANTAPVHSAPVCAGSALALGLSSCILLATRNIRRSLCTNATAAARPVSSNPRARQLSLSVACAPWRRTCFTPPRRPRLLLG